MIPLRDVNPRGIFPALTYALIAVNVVVFLFQVSLGPDAEAFVMLWGAVPARLTGGGDTQAYLTPFSSMFMHGSWMHIIGNMWFLHVFGDNLEEALGRARYLVFYVLTGLCAVAAQVVVGPESRIPMVGASGAIAGVLAGYLVLFPRARIVTLVPIFIFIQFMQIPAWVFLFLWFGYQLLMGVFAVGAQAAGGGGVAFFAHIGGFLAGLVLIKLLAPARRARRAW